MITIGLVFPEKKKDTENKQAKPETKPEKKKDTENKQAKPETKPEKKKA